MPAIPKVLSDVSCGRIAKKIGDKFLPLGLELGFDMADLQAFETTHHKNLVGKNTAMILEWVSNNGDEPRILNKFLTALTSKAVGLNRLAGELRERPDQPYGGPPSAQGGATSSSSAQPGPVKEIKEGTDQPDVPTSAKGDSSSNVQSGPTEDSSDENGSYASHQILPAQPTDDMLNPENNYKLWSKRKGLAYILNNNKFGDGQRHGSKIDLANMIHLFRELGYEINDHEDLKGQEIKDSFKAFALEFNKKNYDSAVVVLMSHGNTGVITGTDKTKVKLKSLHKKLKDCPGLENKPKMYFIQACRGKSTVIAFDDGPETASPESQVIDDEPEPDNDFDDDYVKHLGDVYFAYSTTEGCKSQRKTTGSYFIRAMCEVFFANAHQDNLDTLMTKVTKKLIHPEKEQLDKKSSKHPEADAVQTPERKSSLCKALYFFPKFTKET